MRLVQAVVRKEDFPQYLFDALSNWGACQSSPSRPGRAGGLEGKFRSCRCPECYELALSCEPCRKSQSHQALLLDHDAAVFIEAAWVSLPWSRLEKSLLRGYFVFRQRPRALASALGIRREDFWFLLFRGAQEVYQIARVARMRACAKRMDGAEYFHRESGQAGCLVQNAA